MESKIGELWMKEIINFTMAWVEESKEAIVLSLGSNIMTYNRRIKTET